MTTAVQEYLKYLNKTNETADKKSLFDEPKLVSLQICLHKIPNLIGTKTILCKLPNSLHLNPAKEDPEICLIVKDLDKKDRDYEKTMRKYQSIIDEQQLTKWITMIMPLKQLNLEFRHYEAKRKLATSFSLFLADKCLHEILFSGSKLGKEFRKRRRMPLEIDMNSSKLKEDIETILNSAIIRLTGKGAVIDINTFLSTHSVEQAMANIDAVKTELVKHLPGGESNIKAIYLKSTDMLAVPFYTDSNLVEHINEVKIKNNMTPNKIKKAKKLNVKRLQKKAKIEKKKLKKQEKKAKKTSVSSGNDETKKGVTKTKLNAKSAIAKKNKIKKSVFIK